MSVSFRIGCDTAATVVDRRGGADVLAVMEAENTPFRVRFNDEMPNGRYGHHAYRRQRP